jgi:hypothetical protein
MHNLIIERAEEKLRGELGSAVLASFFLLLSFIKMSAYSRGRFWAEEGTVFYTKISAMGIKGLLLLYYGHIQLVTNAIIYMSTWVPFRFAPTVTTYLGFSFQLLPVLLLIYYRNSINLSFRAAGLLLVVIAGLPQSAEIWATATNLHFHFSLLAAMILVIPVNANYPRRAFRFLLLLAGVSGIPGNILLPLFIASAVIERDRERIIQAGIISLTSILQMTLLFYNGRQVIADRVGFDFSTLWFSILAQQIIAPLSGFMVQYHGSAFMVGSRLIDLLLWALLGNIYGIIFAVACSLPLLYFLAMAIKFKKREAIILISSTMLIAVFSFITSLGSKVDSISWGNNGRYFYVPNVLMTLCLLLVFSRHKNYFIKIYFLLLLSSSIVNVPAYIGGKPWMTAYREAIEQQKDRVEIWPYGWSMPLPQQKPK